MATNPKMNPEYKWENDPLKHMFYEVRSPRIGQTYNDLTVGDQKTFTENGWVIAEPPTPIEEGKIVFRNALRKYYQYTQGTWVEIATPPAVKFQIFDGEVFEDYKQREDPDWVPYCLRTGCMRMRKEPYGFRCPSCGNKIKHDMTRYTE